MIPFNIPFITGNEEAYIRHAIDIEKKISGGGIFNKKCSLWIEQKFNCRKSLLTTSCTHALEMAAILAGIQPGDEVIMPS
ncbi:MAG: DegT/DnrJ/EryC1/StrS family aminotransferase, partial [Firmicutes bacterium]|nr:DegT/DnrJ/EryC1/StrS family aminotransferase [Bacillota bacterium]